MTTDTTLSLEQVDAAVASAVPTLDVAAQRLAVTIYRLLACGKPVSVAAAAAASGVSADAVEQQLRAWPAVFPDDGGAVIGFWGLALSEMPHRLRVGDRELYAWCAWDPLFLAHLIGPLQVATDDPITGETVSYDINAAGTMSALSHPGAVLSFLRPDREWDDNVQATFCHYVLQFTNSAAARRWTADHPGTFVLGLADAVELAGRHVQRMLGVGL